MLEPPFDGWKEISVKAHFKSMTDATGKHILLMDIPKPNGLIVNHLADFTGNMLISLSVEALALEDITVAEANGDSL